MADTFDLDRFVTAQNSLMAQVMRELGAGQKRSHWMWFVFPQIAGLGNSAMTQRYAIGSLRAAQAYLQHPVLGQRLVDCTALINNVEGKTAHQILGSPDDMKFHSSITLFGAADPEAAVFRTAMAKFFAGVPDRRTIEILAQHRTGTS